MRIPTLVPRDSQEAKVLSIWKDSGIGKKSRTSYINWVRSFRRYCRSKALDEIESATLVGAKSFAANYRSKRLKGPVSNATKNIIQNSIHAWVCALKVLGVPIPNWKESTPRRPLPDLVESYLDYRQQHRGVAPATLIRDCQVVTEFLEHLRSLGRRLRSIQVADLDSFVAHLCKRMSRRIAASNCSSLREFLRFLHLTARRMNS